ncbi:peptidase [Eikenella sp. NML96-A-049]|uniref:PepSY domain-containing protein n=1 Tax=unclassified Eikenella TaxID=2639367 RepID=UPI0007E08ACE|nr:MULTISPECIES: PepSY domain-containing protein [unclassified Eikenella]OAM34406.1 peptidase [Eikenella sp. NML070372]OAM39619.1 peptidase [Eikenella sp. NML96-A-049]VDH00565.1 Uncharacterised protein [Helicobacter pametensis]
MIKISFNPNNQAHAAHATKQFTDVIKTSSIRLWHFAKTLRPSRKTVLKIGAGTILIALAAGAGVNYLPKLTGQSNLTTVQAAQKAFATTNGGIITEADFKIGHRGSRYEFEILSGGRKYDVEVDAMSGQAYVN